MDTRADEIASGIFRLSTHLPEVAPPDGFTFNQFLILADQPLLFHCGPRSLFPLVSAAVAAILPVERLRWLSFGHIEADECGAMRSEEHTSELQSLMRISYAVFCLKKKKDTSPYISY